MATGISVHGMAYPDTPGAGASQWEEMAGVSPLSPLVGGPGFDASGSHLPYNIDGARSRVVSNDVPDSRPVAAGGMLLDDWRDLLNFRGSPVPWLLVLTLAMVGFAQFRIQARAGKAKGSFALG
jgi:hypothetical protein